MYFGQIENLRFEVLMAITMKNAILCCDATQSSKTLLVSKKSADPIFRVEE
jgi:hypothetical protein